MNGKTVGIIVIIIILIAGGWYLFNNAPSKSTAVPTATQIPSDQTTGDMQGMQMATATTATDTVTSAPSTTGVTVTYTDQGFSPKSLSVPAGTTVTFVDQSANPLWIASNPHPTHEGYDGTTRSTHCAAGYSGPTPFDECMSAPSYSFTFTKVGSWGYHNHLSPSNLGTVVVTAVAAGPMQPE